MILPVLATIVLWGLWAGFGKMALERGMSPVGVFVTEVAVSAVIAGFVVVGIYQKSGQTVSGLISHAGMNVYGVLSGTALALGLVIYYWALDRGSVTTVATATAGYPVVAVIFALFVLHERPSMLQILGGGLVVAGVAMILSPSK